MRSTGAKQDDINPESSATHLLVFSVPPPQTKYLVLTIREDVFGNEEAKFRIDWPLPKEGWDIEDAGPGVLDLDVADLVRQQRRLDKERLRETLAKRRAVEHEAKMKMRTWTSSSGTTTKAALMSRTGNNLKFKHSSGEVITMTIDQLSKDDQDYINKGGR
jgi:hypothetical protein